MTSLWGHLGVNSCELGGELLARTDDEPGCTLTTSAWNLEPWFLYQNWFQLTTVPNCPVYLNGMPLSLSIHFMLARLFFWLMHIVKHWCESHEFTLLETCNKQESWKRGPKCCFTSERKVTTVLVVIISSKGGNTGNIRNIFLCTMGHSTVPELPCISHHILCMGVPMSILNLKLV